MTKIRLSDHFIADYRDKMIPMRTNNSIERESSLKNHKIKRTQKIIVIEERDKEKIIISDQAGLTCNLAPMLQFFCICGAM